MGGTNASANKKITTIAALAVFGGIAGFGAGHLIKQSGMFFGVNAAQWFTALLLTPLALFLVIVIHELGHLAAAQWVGFRFRVLTLGPWSIIATPTGFRHRLNFKILGLIGGQQISTPVDGRGTDRQFLHYLAGGGVANLVSAALAIALLEAAAVDGFVRAFLVVFAAVSALFGVINLAPVRTGQGIATDGYNMRSIMRNNEEAIRLRAMIELMGNIYSGVRPRDWSYKMVAQLQENAPTEYEKALGPFLAHSFALDRGDLATARETALATEALFDGVPAAFHSHFAVELAYYFGACERDAAKARRYADIAKRGGYLLSPSATHRALAAAAYAEARYADAIAECELGLLLATDGNNELDRMLEPETINLLKALVLDAQRIAA